MTETKERGLENKNKHYIYFECLFGGDVIEFWRKSKEKRSTANLSP